MIRERMANWLSMLRGSVYLRHLIQTVNFVLLFLFVTLALSLDAVYPFNLISTVSFAAFAFFTVVYWILYVDDWIPGPLTILLITLAACMLASFIANGFQAFPKTHLLMIVLIYAVYLWLKSQKEHLSFYLVLFSLASIAFALLFMVYERNYVFHPGTAGRAGRSFGNENDVARNLLLCTIVQLFLVYYNKRKFMKAVHALLALLFAYFVFLTGSVSNTLLLLLVLVVFGIAATPKKWRLVSASAVVVLVGLVISLIANVPAFASFNKRLLSILSSLFTTDSSKSIDSSTVARMSGAVYGIRLFIRSPLFGNGCDSVVRAYKIMAHNNMVETAADYGVFALICEEIIILLPLFWIKKTRSNCWMLVLLVGIYTFGIQFFLVSINSKTISVFTALSIFLVTTRSHPLARIWPGTNDLFGETYNARC